MERIYKEDADKEVTFFIGKEIEHTPAHNMKTLFVVGLQDPRYILEFASTQHCEHIYFGANQSFNGSNILTWTAMVKFIIDNGLWATLDFDIKHVEMILESGLTEYNLFIPMISAKLPYIQQLGYNACLKLDDKDFDKSNPGVWCHMVHDLMDRAKFTNWTQYKDDSIV